MSMRPLKLRRPTVERLPVLLEQLQNGELCIPRLQREFVWDDDQRLQLFDSIRRGLPIGSVMTWSTHVVIATTSNIGPYEIKMREDADLQYLLDGQQRLTTLFAALGPRELLELAEGASLQEWAVYYDLEAEFFVLPKDARAPTCMPAHLLLDGFARHEWLAAQLPNDRMFWTRANALGTAFSDYLIPVVPITSDDGELISLTFKRVNQGGTKMGDFNMVHALTWKPGADGFDLELETASLLEALRQRGWGDLDRDWVLETVAGELGLNAFRFEAEELATKLSADTPSVARVLEQLELTVELLGETGIRGPRGLPYGQQVFFLARAFANTPVARTLVGHARIAYWLVRTSMASALGGLGHDRLSKLLREFESWVALGEPMPNWRVEPCTHYNFSHARSRILAITLARLGPRAASGQPIEDPYGALAQLGNDAIPVLLDTTGNGLESYDRKALRSLPTKLRNSPGNRIIAPHGHLADLRRALLGPAPLPDGVAESHAISTDALEQLRRGHYAAFLEQRHETIWALERNRLTALETEFEPSL